MMMSFAVGLTFGIAFMTACTWWWHKKQAYATTKGREMMNPQASRSEDDEDEGIYEVPSLAHANPASSVASSSAATSRSSNLRARLLPPPSRDQPGRDQWIWKLPKGAVWHLYRDCNHIAGKDTVNTEKICSQCAARCRSTCPVGPAEDMLGRPRSQTSSPTMTRRGRLTRAWSADEGPHSTLGRGLAFLEMKIRGGACDIFPRGHFDWKAA